MKVLLLEDDASLQRSTARLIKRAFSPTELTIDVVDTVAGAIALLQANTYDFVLSDWNVTDGNGGEVLLWIKLKQRHMNERFVFFSGAKNLDQVHHKVIEKGIDSTEFVERLRDYVLVTP